MDGIAQGWLRLVHRTLVAIASQEGSGARADRKSCCDKISRSHLPLGRPPPEPHRSLTSRWQNAPVFPSRLTRPASAAATAALVLLTSPGCGEADAPPNPEFRDVLILTVDGLRSDAIEALPADRLPHLRRLMSQSATLNARTDPTFTVTLPNHTGMVTARFTDGPGGHAWTLNDLPAEGDIESNLGEPVANVFDAARAAGIGTGLFATKDKFGLWPRTWNEDDDGPAIDRVVIEHKQTEPVLEELFAYLRARKAERDLVFLHLHDTDTTGHAHGWNLTGNSEYLATLQEIDAKLGRLIELLESDAGLRDTALILTADHGGGVPYRNHHGQGLQWINYVIPFFVWTPRGAPQAELYALNPDVRQEPSLRMLPGDEWPPPIRNSDAGNLALDLLGLPPLEGSSVNAGQELRVLGEVRE